MNHIKTSNLDRIAISASSGASLKNTVKAFFILGAVENGWTVKKSNKIKNGFEFVSGDPSNLSVQYDRRNQPYTSEPYDSVVSARRCISEPLRIISLR
jgi:hypothetical protein